MKYFISYSYNRSGSIRFGNISINLNSPIIDGDDIIKITGIIEREQQVKEVVILNWKKF
jgi:hypothetical protein